MKKMKHCIFDLGNVLFRFDMEHILSHRFDPKTAEALAPAFFDRRIWDRMDDGTITDEEAKDAICASLPQEYHRGVREVYDVWPALLYPVPGMVELLRELKAAGVKLYLLSNISIGFAEQSRELPMYREVFALFDGLVFSGPIGMVKPNPEIFAHLLKTYGLRAGDCMFIDDSPKNIAGAASVGIDPILFEGDAETLRPRLLAKLAE
ncbi:MAG: HAD family phosphatase [Clostridia bacterium]|nr:HAD family phosphatase [Clostridia bacterium]